MNNLNTQHLFRYDGAQTNVPIWQNYYFGDFQPNCFSKPEFKFFPVWHRFRVWTGIGSRKVPEGVAYLQKNFSRFLASRGWICRTGDAAGSDRNFKEGSEYTYGGSVECYTPRDGITPSAMESVVHFHPNPPALGHPDSHTFRLMARNFYQVTGHPKLTRLQPNQGYLSQFVVGYAPGGFAGGGTSQAFRLARHFGIPVYNLYPTVQTEMSEEDYAKMIFCRILSENYAFTAEIPRWGDFSTSYPNPGRQCF